MIDFLFITSPSCARNPHPPYYFMYLAAYLKEKGLKVKIIDPKGGDKPKDIENHIRSIKRELILNKARFVGLAAFHNDYPMVVRLGELIKRIQSNTTLLVGNAHATINPEDFIYKFSPFDIAVLGEGEETCWELWQAKMRKRQQGIAMGLDKIPGIAYFDYGFDTGTTHHRIVKTEPRKFINLKDLPMPAYNLVNMDYYLKPQKLIARRIYTSVMPIFAGRGCPYSCTFCASNVVWKANKGKATRLRSVDRVLQEIKYLRDNYQLDFFYMFDDTFGMDEGWLEEWFEKKNMILPNMPYACQTRANLIDKPMIKGLKETGCIQVDIGLETGSQRLLDIVHKRITIDQVRRAVRIIQYHHLRYFFTMLLNLPTETEEDLKQTSQLLKELKPHGVIFGITTPYPGTKIYIDYCPQGLKKEEYHLLTGNRLDPLEQFRMAEHKLDLWKLFDQWNRKFKATPLFERMWPRQALYWQTVLKSNRLELYIQCWIKDLCKTPILWLVRRLDIYQWLKKKQYDR